MIRPLTKHRKDGAPYARQPGINAALEIALAQGEATLLQRTSIRDPRSHDYLPSECLVYLIREEMRSSKRRPILSQFLMILLQRCEAILENGMSNRLLGVETLRAEILSRFSVMLAEEGMGEHPGRLDFYEIRFNKAFFTFYRAIIEAEVAASRKRRIPVSSLRIGLQQSDEEIFAMISTHGLVNESYNRSIDHELLLRAIDRLPDTERQAVILCGIMGYQQESDDPTVETAATRCGVTGKTIRNRLKKAATRLAQFREDLS